MQAILNVMRRTCIACCIILLINSNTHSQTDPPLKLDLSVDTVSWDAAIKSQARFKSDLVNANKKATSQITMSVSKISEVMSTLSALGITNVTFLIVTIRKEDTANYAKRHPGISNAARNDLIGRQQLLLRVPRAAFIQQQQGSGKIIRPNRLIIAMTLLGISPIDYYTGVYGSGDLYLGLGTICPPPASCD